MTRIGVCKVNSHGQICHKNAYARELCEARAGDQCALHKEYLSQPHQGMGEFILPEIIYKTKEHVAAAAIKIEDGYQIYFRSIENDPSFADLLPKEEVVSLTHAESTILEKVFLKKSNQEIADSLFISLATVKTHLAHLYQKIPKLKQWRKKHS